MDKRAAKTIGEKEPMAVNIKCQLTEIATGRTIGLPSIQAARYYTSLSSAQIHYYLRKAEALGQPCIIEGYKLERR
jgi:hypothetical protein